MPSVAEMPSLIDDADFLAELDKLEAVPPPPELDVLSAYWNHATRVEEAGGQLPALTPIAVAPAPPARHTRSAKPGRPVRLEKPLRLDTPGRIEMPLRPEVPARSERPALPKRPVRPAHVDEIGKSGYTSEQHERAVSEPQPLRVPAALAALTIVLCFSAGAGSAALVFHDRVAQIAVTWRK
jgi:hypothetical protein